MSMHRRLLPYGVAISSTTIALLLRVWLAPLLPASLGTFFYIAVMVSSWYGGLSAGLVSTVLSAIALATLFLPPTWQYWVEQPSNIFQLFVFILVSLTITFLNNNHRNSIDQIKQLNQQLAQENADRKQAEQALRVNEARLRLAQVASEAGVWDWNIETDTLFWSPEYYQLYEIDPATPSSVENWLQCIHPDDRDLVMNQLQHALTNSSSNLRIEFRIVSNGGVRWFAGMGQIFRDEAGKPMRMLGLTIDITQQKQSEIELHELNEALEQRVAERTAELNQQKRLIQQITDTAPAIVYIFDLIEQRNLYINSGVTRILGYSPTEIQAMGAELLVRLLHPDDFARITAWVEGLMAAEETTALETEYRMRRINGSWCWLYNQVTVFQRSSNGLPSQILGVAQDITERKQVEANLERELLRSNALYKASFDGIVTLNKQGYVVSASLSFSKMLGYSLEELLTLHVSDWNAQWSKEELSRIINSSELIDSVFETRHRRKDGSLFDVEISVNEVIFEDETVRLCICRDITDRKRKEATLREADRRWQSLLDNVQLIVIQLDQTGTVEYANPFFLELTHFALDEVLGQNWSRKFIPKHQQTSVQTCFHDIIEQNLFPHYQNSILTKSGEERIIDWNNTLLRDLEGNPIGSISIGEDITDRHRLEKMKSEFLSIVSHELRTPLTAINGALELLATGLLPIDSSRAKQSIQIAAAEADRLTRMVNDILDLERLESGKLKLQIQSCNLATLMQRACDFMQLMADQNQITLSVTPLAVELQVDGDRILQVLTNLLNNAIKFSPPLSTIWLTAQVIEDIPPQICVTMRDQGRGIPTNKLATIFDRFQQVDASDSRQKGGTGLGLAICRNIVQQHGGTIWAESILGEGSQFHFTLPLS